MPHITSTLRNFGNRKDRLKSRTFRVTRIAGGGEWRLSPSDKQLQISHGCRRKHLADWLAVDWWLRCIFDLLRGRRNKHHRIHPFYFNGRIFGSPSCTLGYHDNKSEMVLMTHKPNPLNFCRQIYDRRIKSCGAIVPQFANHFVDWPTTGSA